MKKTAQASGRQVVVSMLSQVAIATGKTELQIQRINTRFGIPMAMIPGVLSIVSEKGAKINKVAELLMTNGEIRFSLDRISDIYDVRDDAEINVGFVAELIEHFYDLADGDADFISQMIQEIDRLIRDQRIKDRKEFLLIGRGEDIENAGELIEYLETDFSIGD